MSRLAVAFAAALLAIVAVPSASAALLGERAARCSAGPCWITLTKLGSGTGTVTSEPSGMDCGDTCLAPFFHGSTAALVATPAPGSRFTRWEGACDVPNGSRCNLFMEDGKAIRAVFDLVGAPDSPPPPPPPTSPAPPAPPSVPPPAAGACTITGTPGSDELNGTPGRDVICALGGADHIHPGGGPDVVLAGGGADEVEAGAGADRVEGGAGDDALFGDAGADRITGGAGRDTVAGGAGADTLVLKDGARDVVRGGPGVDRARVDARDRVSGTERRF